MTKTDIKTPSTTKRIGKFFVIGVSLALFNFILYAIIARVVNNNGLLWLISLISVAITAILAYFLHSKITWRERPVTKRGIINFFIWNALLALVISPGFTWLFGFFSPLYEFTYNLSQTLNFPFDYNFIESTSIFILVNIITMILNYLFYDRLVFGKSKV